jgi:hypothetical protein
MASQRGSGKLGISPCRKLFKTVGFEGVSRNRRASRAKRGSKANDASISRCAIILFMTGYYIIKLITWLSINTGGCRTIVYLV